MWSNILFVESYKNMPVSISERKCDLTKYNSGFFCCLFTLESRSQVFLSNNSKVSFMINNCKISPPHVVNMLIIVSPYMKNLALSCVESHAPSIDPIYQFILCFLDTVMLILLMTKLCVISKFTNYQD